MSTPTGKTRVPELVEVVTVQKKEEEKEVVEEVVAVNEWGQPSKDMGFLEKDHELGPVEGIAGESKLNEAQPSSLENSESTQDVSGSPDTKKPFSGEKLIGDGGEGKGRICGGMEGPNPCGGCVIV